RAGVQPAARAQVAGNPSLAQRAGFASVIAAANRVAVNGHGAEAGSGAGLDRRPQTDRTAEARTSQSHWPDGKRRRGGQCDATIAAVFNPNGAHLEARARGRGRKSRDAGIAGIVVGPIFYV